MYPKRVINYDFYEIEHEVERWGKLIWVKEISSTDIRDLLKRTRVTFIVAKIGSPLKWIPEHESFSFWKDEVKVRLVEPSQVKGFHLEDYPLEYCYSASVWRNSWKDDLENSYILLKMYH